MLPSVVLRMHLPYHFVWNVLIKYNYKGSFYLGHQCGTIFSDAPRNGWGPCTPPKPPDLEKNGKRANSHGFRAVLLELFFFSRFSSVFFPRKTGKSGKNSRKYFPNFGNLTEGKISGTHSIPIHIQGSPSGCVRCEIPGLTQVDEKGHEGNTAAVTAYPCWTKHIIYLSWGINSD